MLIPNNGIRRKNNLQRKPYAIQKTEYTLINCSATYVHRGGAQFKKNQAPAPSHPPPAGYVCYRCGEKGHWIQQCPTNNDPSFDGRPRVKRTTGIPRSFLKTVEKPTHIPGADDGSNGQNPTSIMVNAEGEYVVAMPDQSSWEKYQQKAASGNQKQNDDPAGLEELKSLGIDCKICKKVLNDAVKTPCCGTHYCEECIQNTLLESDFVCPNCDAKEQPLEGLVADTEAREKVQKFRDDKEKPQQSLPPTSSTAPTAPPTGTVPSTTPATNIPAPEKTPTTSSATLNAPPGPRSNSTTPNPSSTPSSVPSGPNPKKRSAESDLGPEVPRGPAAMRNAVPPNSTNNPPKFSPNNNVAIPSFPAGPAVNNNPNSYNNFSNGPNNNFGVGGFDNFGFGVMPGMPGMGMMMGMSGFNGFNNGFNAQGGAYSGAQNGYNNFGGASNNGYMNSGAGWNNQGYPAGGQNGYNAMGGGMNGMNPMMGGYGGGYGMGGMNMGMGGMGIQGAGMNGMMGPGMGGVEGEDSPYMRKPVNPHRHTRPKRPRPSDFKAVGGEM